MSLPIINKRAQGLLRELRIPHLLPFFAAVSFYAVILIWLAIMLVSFLIQHIREGIRINRKPYDLGAWNLPVYSGILLLVVWGIFHFAKYEPQFSDAEEQIKFGARTNQPWLQTQGYSELIEQHPDSLELHFQRIDTYFKQNEKAAADPGIGAYNREGVDIFMHYTELAESADVQQRDLGNLMLAFWYIRRPGHDYDNAALHLKQIKQQCLKYYNYAAGEIMSNHLNVADAITYYEKEISCNGYIQGAWRGLSLLYYRMNNNDSIVSLIDNPRTEDHVHPEIKSQHYFKTGNILMFYVVHFEEGMSHLHVWGLVTAIIAAFVWMLYLKRLNFLSAMKWPLYVYAVLTGAALSVLCWIFYAVYNYTFGFDLNGELLNDFLYCFLGVGVIEELVKVAAFVVLFIYSKQLRTAADYMIVACCAGLGFSLFENVLYSSVEGLDVIFSRTLTASVAHMVSSAIVAYGFILWKFRWLTRIWIVPICFVIAALVHGFYDFWLLNPSVQQFSIITFVFFLMEILLFTSLLNNALNQSAPKTISQRELAFDGARNAGLLSGGLILIFVIQYIGMCAVYGSNYGEQVLTASFVSGSYLVFFLSIRLSSIDIAPGVWNKIDFYSGLLPAAFFSGTGNNYNALVGTTLVFGPHEYSQRLSAHLPFVGKISRRVRIKGDFHWFEVIPEPALTIEGIYADKLYIKTHIDQSEIVPGNKTVVRVFVPTPAASGGGKKSLVFYDLAVAT